MFWSYNLLGATKWYIHIITSTNAVKTQWISIGETQKPRYQLFWLMKFCIKLSKIICIHLLIITIAYGRGNSARKYSWFLSFPGVNVYSLHLYSYLHIQYMTYNISKEIIFKITFVIFINFSNDYQVVEVFGIIRLEKRCSVSTRTRFSYQFIQ